MNILSRVVIVSVAVCACSVHAESAFNFESVKARAQELSTRPYAPRVSQVPEWLRQLTYDQYRQVRFKPEKSLWRGQSPFWLQFFHPGFIQTKTVEVAEIVDGKVVPVAFDPSAFSYDPALTLQEIPSNMGFSGLRATYPLNTTAYNDELIVFQGASYFRALGKDMHWGLSARGLALNSGQPGGEEFPIFEEFWVQRPTAKTKELVLFALMDTPSLTGAYRFTIKPGAETVLRVSASLYRRAGATMGVFGMAPLTSMFWFGENSLSREGDLRPEVHDSDGLLMERGNGEWIWRPLANPPHVRTSAFADENPRGFGLVQRDREYTHYEDLEASYHLRPSTWVEPIGSWGKGSVRLVELPTPDETNDNIVAFWVPEALPPEGQPIEFEYLLHWFMEHTGGKKIPGGYVVSTRQGSSKTHEPDLVRFWVDFDSPILREMPGEAGVQAIIELGDGAKLTHHSVQKNPVTGKWRVALSIRPDADKRPVELRCFLKKDSHYLSETWSYLWNP